MKTTTLTKNKVLQTKKLPDAPGVYFFLGRNRKILYIGRATSLRDRVRSYFHGDILESRSPWIAKMLQLIAKIDYRKTDSVLEAVLLEANLIKKLQPSYNTDEKDDKSFNCVVITKEPFPAVFVVRQTDINFSSLRIKDKGLKISAIFGPFPNGFQLQTAMKIIRKIFPYRDLKCKLQTVSSEPRDLSPLKKGVPESARAGVVPLSTRRASNNPPASEVSAPFVKGDSSSGKPCFNRQIGLCPGTCTGEISRKDYAKAIRNLRLFFEGKKSRLIKLLKNEMRLAARAQAFEKAGELKRQLFALKHIQDIALLKNADFRGYTNGYNPSSASIRGNIGVHPRLYRIEAYDLSHFGGKEIVGAMAVVEDGIAASREYRLFKIHSIQNAHEVEGLREILRRRFNHLEWKSPDLIVVDGNEVQKGTAEAILKELEQTIPVVAVVKDEKHEAREILGLKDGHHPAGILQDDAHRAILLANGEAHRFALGFGRKRLRLAAGLVAERI